MVDSANLNVMIKTARKAGRGLLKDFAEIEQIQVSVKGPGDFVSRADRKAEQTIREMLMEAYPSYGFLREEGSAVEGEDPTRRRIADPLDGTSNCLHGLPHWAVSIALEHKGQIVAGVKEAYRRSCRGGTEGRTAMLLARGVLAVHKSCSRRSESRHGFHRRLLRCPQRTA